MTSLEAAKQFEDNSLDFVYIDACHQYDDVVEDIKLWEPKVRPGGWIGGHDFADWKIEVKNAVLDTLGKPEYVFQDSSWLFQIDNKKV